MERNYGEKLREIPRTVVSLARGAERFAVVLVLAAALSPQVARGQEVGGISSNGFGVVFSIDCNHPIPGSLGEGRYPLSILINGRNLVDPETNGPATGIYDLRLQRYTSGTEAGVVLLDDVPREGLVGIVETGQANQVPGTPPIQAEDNTSYVLEVVKSNDPTSEVASAALSFGDAEQMCDNQASPQQPIVQIP